MRTSGWRLLVEAAKVIVGRSYQSQPGAESCGWCLPEKGKSWTLIPNSEVYKAQRGVYTHQHTVEVKTVQRLDPDFLAVHCQEVGGKNYEESMQHVNLFIKTLLASKEMQQFDKARVFLDEDFTAVDKFTALGSLYFVHQSIQNVQIFDWQDCRFVPVMGREVLSGNIETVAIKEKAKFPQQFFPDSKWSRKGFIRTRWNICNTLFDHINIHLFHDASNIVAMESNPSQYCENRRRAMTHTLERFDNDNFDKVPYIIFGDFNFRLDTHTLIKKLTDKLEAQHMRGKKNEISKIMYTTPHSSQPVLTIEKKGFDYYEHHSDFSNNNNKWLHEFDREVHSYTDRLYEYDISFPPSYPFSEDVEDGTSYMKTRCPSWCDRILMSHTTNDIIYHDENDTLPEYNIIGPTVCMGDHKPVYLNFRLRQGAGKDPTSDPSLLSHSPPSSLCSVKRGTLTKVISINGEEVDCSSNMDHVNIHDFATFEQEEVLTTHFFSTIRRRTLQDGLAPSCGSSASLASNCAEGLPLKRDLSFKRVAWEIAQKENVLLALKHYSHRSDSEESEVEEEESCKSMGSGSSVFVPIGSEIPEGISESNHKRLSVVTEANYRKSHLVSVEGTSIPIHNNSIPLILQTQSLDDSHLTNAAKQPSVPTKRVNSTSTTDTKTLPPVGLSDLVLSLNGVELEGLPPKAEDSHHMERNHSYMSATLCSLGCNPYPCSCVVL